MQKIYTVSCTQAHYNRVNQNKLSSRVLEDKVSINGQMQNTKQGSRICTKHCILKSSASSVSI